VVAGLDQQGVSCPLVFDVVFEVYSKSGECGYELSKGEGRVEGIKTIKVGGSGNMMMT